MCARRTTCSGTHLRKGGSGCRVRSAWGVIAAGGQHFWFLFSSIFEKKTAALVAFLPRREDFHQMSRLSHTLSLSERLKRQRDGTASATPVGERAGPFGCTPSSPAGALLHTGDLRGPGGGAEASSWWRAQNDSVSKLDGLLSNLGVSSSLRTTADVSGPSLQREVLPHTSHCVPRSSQRNGEHETNIFDALLIRPEQCAGASLDC